MLFVQQERDKGKAGESTMKTTTKTLVFAFVLLLSGVLAAESAFARGPRGHGHGRIGIGIHFGVPLMGFPYYYPPYRYAPYYYPSYYPAPVIIRQQAPVYVEQDPEPAPQAQPSSPAGYWYYCADAGAYYPYVKQCPGGWQRVAPQPG
jgi:hypothetical protein